VGGAARAAAIPRGARRVPEPSARVRTDERQFKAESWWSFLLSVFSAGVLLPAMTFCLYPP
jgi:hypothetical protein